MTESAFITVMKGNFPRCIYAAVELTAVHCDIIEEEGDFHCMTVFEMYSKFHDSNFKRNKSMTVFQVENELFL